MEIEFTQQAQNDLKFWKKSGNKPIQKKIAELLEAILENPIAGIGKPEPLKYELTGRWSRRINEEHRIIYLIADKIIYIQSLKGHY